ncbi:MAG: aspartate aminotransferase family protein [SAR202 cluster bacterium]|nr:aspartate aminotransferase family protein [SAR202 cluster bacterium]
MNQYIETEKQFYMGTVRRQPVVIERGQGTRVWDTDGKEYLDFTAGWAVDCLGHSAPVMVEAISKQAATLIQTSNQFYTLPQLQLVEWLVKNSCLDKVFLCNSGAEANEGAIKLARKYGRDNRNGAVEIITAIDSFHGRTTGALAATGNANYQANFLPLMTGFVHVPFGDIDAIKAATNEGTCAVMLEPVQGEGGVISPPDGYLKAVRQWCDEQGILLILDEIQTGVGRLGTMWGYEQFDIEPDVMTIAKAMGGGVPIGAFLCKDACDVLRPGDHGSTYGGNALTCAASYAVLNHVKEEGLVEHGRLMGERLKGKLEEVKARHETTIKEVRGMGLLLAVEFYEPISGELVTSCNAGGLLLNPVRPTAVRFMPPLNISEPEVDIAVDRFERSLEDALQRIEKAK